MEDYNLSSIIQRKNGILASLILTATSLITTLSIAQSIVQIGPGEELETSYLRLSVLTYAIPTNLEGRIRSVSKHDEELIAITAEGVMFRISKDLSIKKMDFPPPDLNVKGFIAHNKYNYFEALPHVHDIASVGGVFYATYDYFDETSGRIRFKLAVLNPRSKKWSVIFESTDIDTSYYALGAGGRMLPRGDNLFFTVGDYSLDRANGLPSDFAAANDRTPFGKIFYLETKTGVVSEYSRGHRNPLGIATLGNQIIVTDNGPRGGDGIFVLNRGDNCGWPFVSFGMKYLENSAISAQSNIGDQVYKYPYKGPDFVFLPSIAPTQIIQINELDGKWRGDWLVGSLKAMKMFRLHREGGRFIYAEPISIGHRIRNIIEWNKAIWLLSDSGYLIQLTASRQQELYANVTEKLRICMSCHSIDRGQEPTNYGPNLFYVFNRPIASSAYSNYSKSIKGAARLGKWTRENLFGFLRSPQMFAPGTTMPDLPLSLSDADIQATIDALAELK